MNQEEQGKKMSQIIAKCWADEGFKQKLLADPAATLAAEGVPLPAGLTVKAVENTDTLFHLVIPAKPSDLSEEDLDNVSGGSACCCDAAPSCTGSCQVAPTITCAVSAFSQGACSR